jgi:two-component system chemotaxis response regulator CheB
VAPDAASDAELIAIGCSAGGPAALQALLPALPGDALAAVVVAQHMPARFTTLFAARLSRLCALPVAEPDDGERLHPGRIYIAPGGRQILLARDADGVRFIIRARQTGERYAPSADLLMTSAARAFGAAVLGILLSGMGSDGVLGLRSIKDAGGCTVVESEETAAVFGMPRGAIRAGLADRVLARPAIASALAGACRRGGRR